MPLGPQVSAPESLPVHTEVVCAATEPPRDLPKVASRPSRAGFGQPLTEYDMTKDRQIHRSGVWQAAILCPQAAQYAEGTSLEDFLKCVEKIAEAGSKWVLKQD